MNNDNFYNNNAYNLLPFLCIRVFDYWEKYIKAKRT